MSLTTMMHFAKESHKLSNKKLADMLRDLVWAELNMDSLESALVEEAIERLRKVSNRAQPAQEEE